MDNTREKLIELLKSGGVRDFPFNAALADRLIANGVTFAKDINVLNKKIAELEKSNRNWRRKIQKIRQRYTKNNNAVWIPVTERLPDKHGKYLTVVPSRWVGVEHGIWVIWYHPKSGFYDSDPEWGDIEMDDVTHWMPLPSTEGLE